MSNNNEFSTNVKHVSNFEKWFYVLGCSFLAMFTGMINNYKGDYLNNILKMTEKNQQIINVVTLVLIYVIGFFITNFIDNFKSKKGKFKPLALAFCIPFALFGFFMFFTPFEGNSIGGLIWVSAVVVIYNSLLTFGNSANNIAYVITPCEKERNSIISTKSFFTSILNSGSLVIIAVLGVFRKKGWFDKQTMYYIATGLCAVCYAVTMFISMARTKERLPFNEKKNSIFEGIGAVFHNKNFWFLTLSHCVRNVRLLGTAFGIYVAGCLLGSTDNFLLIGLPTGIGTFVGMLIVQKLIKKIDPIKVYWIFGIYSLVANSLAFLFGYIYLTTSAEIFKYLFVLFLFAIGLQFGSSNIIPSIFNGDIMNELEYQTRGKRLEQTVQFAQGIFTTITAIIVGYLSPYILLTVCGYQQGVDVVQTQDTSLKLLFFYTMFSGIFFCVSLIPMLGYKLNTDRRNKINAILEEQRAQIAKENAEIFDEDTVEESVTSIMNDTITSEAAEESAQYFNNDLSGDETSNYENDNVPSDKTKFNDDEDNNTTHHMND